MAVIPINLPSWLKERNGTSFLGKRAVGDDARHMAARKVPAAAPATPPEPGDSELLRRITAGDEAALRLFYRRYSGLVFSLAQRMLHDVEQAEEIVQETFFRVWRVAGTFDPERGRPEAWIVTIARNLTLSVLRKGQTALATASSDEMGAIPDEAAGPEEVAWISARRQIVREALALLPEQQRRVVVFAYFDGLTQAEIAARTGEPLGTVKSRLRLALRRLESVLQISLGDEPIPNQPERHERRQV